MAYKVTTVEVWAGDIMNRPGMLARVLEALHNARAQLEFLIARKASESTSRVFLAPLKSAKQKQAARDVGLMPAKGIHAFRVEGPDKPGLGATITRAIAGQGINLRGASAAGVGKKALFYLAVNSAEDRAKAMAIVKKTLSGRGK